MGAKQSKSPKRSLTSPMFKFTSKSGFTRARKVTKETRADHIPAKSVRSKSAIKLIHPKKNKDPIAPQQDTLTFRDNRKAVKMLRSMRFMQETATKYMETIWWQQIVMAMSVMMNTKDKKNIRSAHEASSYFYNYSGDYLQLYHHLKQINKRLKRLSRYQWQNAQNAIKYRIVRDWYNTLKMNLIDPLELHFNELLNTGFVTKSLRKFQLVPLHVYMKLKLKTKPRKLQITSPSPKKK